MAVKVEPTCRYGHGPMEPFGDREKDLYMTFGIQGLNLDPATKGDKQWAGYYLSCYGFKCKTCGYLEFFDDATEP